MNTDDLEFLIAQYADGTLDPRRSAEVEALLRRDPEARLMLESYRSIDVALAGVAGAAPAPEVRWDRLQDRISRQLGGVAGPAIFSEEVETQIAGYADGSLSAAEHRLITARLEADPQARLVAGQYATLERALDATRADRPNVRWDALANHLCSVVTGTQAESTRETSADSYKLETYRAVKQVGAGIAKRQQSEPADAAVAGRIGFVNRWVAQPRRLAIAACLLIAGSVSIRLMSGGNTVAPITPTTAVDSNPSVAKVTPPEIVIPGQQTPPGSGIANVQIGPPPGGVDRGVLSNGFSTEATNRGGSSVVGKKVPGQDKNKDQGDAAAVFPK